MREWFILFLFLSFQVTGYNLLSGGHFYPPSEKLSVSADKILTVPIGGSGGGDGTGDGTDPGTGPGTGTETGAGTGIGIETGED